MREAERHDHLIPSLLGQILSTGNLAVTAGGLTVMIGVSAVTQIPARRVPVAVAQPAALPCSSSDWLSWSAPRCPARPRWPRWPRCAAAPATAWCSAWNYRRSWCPRRQRNAPRSSASSTPSTTPARATRTGPAPGKTAGAGRRAAQPGLPLPAWLPDVVGSFGVQMSENRLGCVAIGSGAPADPDDPVQSGSVTRG
jgi:hypothetical protein